MGLTNCLLTFPLCAVKSKTWKQLKSAKFQGMMNNNKSTELLQPTTPGMHYTACCVHVASNSVQLKHEHFFI